METRRPRRVFQRRARRGRRGSKTQTTPQSHSRYETSGPDGRRGGASGREFCVASPHHRRTTRERNRCLRVPIISTRLSNAAPPPPACRRRRPGALRASHRHGCSWDGDSRAVQSAPLCRCCTSGRDSLSVSWPGGRPRFRRFRHDVYRRVTARRRSRKSLRPAQGNGRAPGCPARRWREGGRGHGQHQTRSPEPDVRL